MATYDQEKVFAASKKKSATELVKSAFWQGFFLHMVLNLFIQDWYGKEKFIELVNEQWMNIHWAVWIAPVCIILALYAGTKRQASDIRPGFVPYLRKKYSEQDL